MHGFKEILKGEAVCKRLQQYKEKQSMSVLLELYRTVYFFSWMRCVSVQWNITFCSHIFTILDVLSYIWRLLLFVVVYVRCTDCCYLSDIQNKYMYIEHSWLLFISLQSSVGYIGITMSICLSGKRTSP